VAVRVGRACDIHILTLEFVFMFHTPSPQRKRMFACLAIGLASALVMLASVVWTGVARADTTLLMVEQEHCEWCAAWNAEIGGIYHLTDEGKRAPLRRQNLFEVWPDDIAIEGQVHFTPTFILLLDGEEVGRIEGYPGQDFFWPLLNQMLNRTPAGATKKGGSGS
jgi:hypothetical protein